MTKPKTVTLLAIVALSTLLMASECSDASIASQNISEAADAFEIDRRIVFYNGITDTYMLTIVRCGAASRTKVNQLEVPCKLGDGKFVKHFLGLSDNVDLLRRADADGRPCPSITTG